MDSSARIAGQWLVLNLSGVLSCPPPPSVSVTLMCTVCNEGKLVSSMRTYEFTQDVHQSDINYVLIHPVSVKSPYNILPPPANFLENSYEVKHT